MANGSSGMRGSCRFSHAEGKGKEPQFNTKQQVLARRINGMKYRNGEI